jgi:hypothetical protein
MSRRYVVLLAHVSSVAAGSLLPISWGLKGGAGLGLAWLGLPNLYAHTSLHVLMPCLPESRHFFTDILSGTALLTSWCDSLPFSSKMFSAPCSVGLQAVN